MVLVIQVVQKIAIERMDIVKTREILQDGGNLLVKVRLCILHLSHVKLPDAVDGIALVHHGGSLPLRPRQDNIHKLLARRHHRNLLEIIEHHLAPLSQHPLVLCWEKERDKGKRVTKNR